MSLQFNCDILDAHPQFYRNRVFLCAHRLQLEAKLRLEMMMNMMSDVTSIHISMSDVLLNRVQMVHLRNAMQMSPIAPKCQTGLLAPE